MENVWIVLLLVAIIVAAGWYVYRAKKKGNACIGCPGCSGGHCTACHSKNANKDG